MVLINAGTNDCRQQDGGSAPQRIRNLVSDIFQSIEGTTIILSGLLPSRDVDICAQVVGAGYEALLKSYQSQGKKIVFANMHNGYLTQGDIPDGTHPNDFGYKKMAAVWWQTFQDARNRGFITAPLDNGLPDDATTAVCDKIYGMLAYVI